VSRKLSVVVKIGRELVSCLGPLITCDCRAAAPSAELGNKFTTLKKNSLQKGKARAMRQTL